MSKEIYRFEDLNYLISTVVPLNSTSWNYGTVLLEDQHINRMSFKKAWCGYPLLALFSAQFTLYIKS